MSKYKEYLEREFIITKCSRFMKDNQEFKLNNQKYIVKESLFPYLKKANKLTVGFNVICFFALYIVKGLIGTSILEALLVFVFGLISYFWITSKIHDSIPKNLMDYLEDKK